MHLPTIYRGGGGWFLALQVHWGVGKGGGQKSHHFPSPLIVIPPFRDLDLIPSGYDLIPSKGGSWCALNRVWGLAPTTHVHVGPPCRWAPFRNLPGTIPKNPEHFPLAKIGLPIYKSLPTGHSGTPRDVRDLIRDSERLSYFRILISLQP